MFTDAGEAVEGETGSTERLEREAEKAARGGGHPHGRRPRPRSGLVSPH